jgi:hypothetical protein
MKKILLVFIIVVISVFYVFLDLKKSKKQEFFSENKISEQEVDNSKNSVVQENIDNTEDSEEIILENENRNFFVDNFSTNFNLEETGKMETSGNQYWWVNSGAFLYVGNGTGKTIFGDLDKGSLWQKKYKDYNSKETDGGLHPQNIFRLVTRSKWKNYRQECYYKIGKYILSKAKERSESNGILLFNRYQDGDNLYYTGLRVDGTAIIKKKKKGKYYTMAQKAFYPGVYNKKKNPNLLPIGKWIGVKSEVRDNPDGTVTVSVYIDKNRSGEWVLALTAIDNGKSFGGAAIKDEGYAGIRTDFMDVEFDDYKIEEIKEQ